ncbi:hypothetical protein [Pseudogulbenkiania sp. MAI-1]|uniref:hypothetical protein n=1 Tax=Pseudogulbenkiania sp. MAI-1 TaxID=990370 RepID=UPI0012EB7AEA|nr:hypothetical protein [Pseudogulbenkiania sp. MAI-1]
MCASDLESYARAWVDAVSNAPAVAQARHLYAGQGAASARATEERCGVELQFVSAGLGVISADEVIPLYDLTVSKLGPGPCHSLGSSATPSAWWSALCRARGCQNVLAQMIKCRDDLAIVALPETYLAMIEDDLCSLTEEHMAKLRIIVARKAKVPGRLRQWAIPYDSRLNQLAGARSGSVSSLAARAAFHFISLIREVPTLLDIDAQRAEIQRLLDAVTPVVKPVRKFASDDQILSAILAMKSDERWGRSYTLGKLRNELGIACEERRFRGIFAQAEACLHGSCERL